MSEIPEWMPDWRDESTYKFPKRQNLTGWAWEFLRRNPAYQNAWQDNYVDGPLRWIRELLGNRGSLSEAESKSIYADNEDRFDNMHCDPPALPGETEKQYMARVERSRMVPLGCHLSEIFGLSGPDICDPAEDNFQKPFGPVFLSLFGPTFVPWSPCAPIKHGLVPEAPGHFVARFDLNLPINLQLDRIKRTMNAQRSSLSKEGHISPISKRPHTDLYPRYIRLLDGKQSGASNSEMASVLFPTMSNEYPGYQGNRSVKNQLRAAEKLRDRDYRYLNFYS